MTVAELKTPLKTSKTSTAFRHILVATDFSETSRRALCDAVALAVENEAQLSLVHVLQPDRKYGALENPPELDLERIAAEKQIKALVDELGPEQKIDATLVKHGPVAEQVASVIEERAIDLLVIGTRGRGGLQKLALGSVAEELLRIAPCPVMTIGPKADIATIANGSGFHRILFATDFGKGSAKALPIALELARAQQAKLLLLHMMVPMPATSASLSAYAPAGAAADELAEWEESSRRRCIKQLRECLPAEISLEQEIEYVVGTDFLAEGILLASGKFKVDLIVMGANRTASPKAAAHLPWAAVHEVVRNAPCPVLTVAG
jgi:nucleotide-binding universal stress UspA family protein